MLQANVNYMTAKSLPRKDTTKHIVSSQKFLTASKNNVESHRLSYNEDFTQTKFLWNIVTLGSDAGF